MNAETGTSLAIPAGTDLVTILRNEDALEAMISRIEDEVMSHAPDLTTAKGRKEIASLAYKVARSKTAIDNAGKEANAGLREQINAVDAARRVVRERMDALQVKARAPLDKWEADEEARKAALTARLAEISTADLDASSAPDDIAKHIAKIEAVEIGEDWREFREQADHARNATLASLRQSHAIAVQRAEEQAELARLRAEAEERARRDEAERLERERVEQERREAEEAARRAAEAKEREQAEREAQARREAEAADRARQEAEMQAKREAEERERQAQEALAAERRRTEEAEKRAAEAAEAERRRIAEEQRRADEARAKREADAAHRAKIAGEIADALRTMAGRATPEAIAEALISGKIPHTKVYL